MCLRFLLAAVFLFGCASPPAEAPPRGGYPFAGVRRVVGTPAAGQARLDYPEVFQVVDDPARTGELDMRALRDDLAHLPVADRNFRALWAVAAAFFELHARAERQRGRQLYFAYSFQATKMVAIPWRPYAEIPDRALRSAILDFYEDVLFGNKPGLAAVRGRYTQIIADLGEKETDPALRARSEDLVRRAEALTLPRAR